MEGNRSRSGVCIFEQKFTCQQTTPSRNVLFLGGEIRSNLNPPLQVLQVSNNGNDIDNDSSHSRAEQSRPD